MRKAFVETLVELAAKDERVFLLTGDLGFMALEPFVQRFPDRFINVGVAEQNMMGIATGLASSGFIPFAYSIATFACLRPYEFIRNGAVGHALPVRVVGVGAGFEYSHNGISHFALEDIAVMRAQPALSVVAPADAQQTRTALEKTWNLPGPTYYRLGKDDSIRIPGLDGRFELDEVQVVRDGRDCLIVSTGAISREAFDAADQLLVQGVSASHAVVSSFNPVPEKALVELLEKHSAVVTVESHYAVGGLFSMLSEVIVANGLNTRVRRCAVEKMPDGKTGDLKFMHERNGLSAEAIVRTALTVIEQARSACPTR